MNSNFEQFCKDTLIAVTTYDRPKITKICIDQLLRCDGVRNVWRYDDASKAPASLAGLTKDIILKRNVGIDALRVQIQRDAEASEFKFIYHTDNDAFHDPDFMQRLHELWLNHNLPIGIYNSKFHPVLKKLDNQTSERAAASGISFFYPIEKLQNKLHALNKNTLWDWGFAELLNRQFIISDISYVEHFGAGGLHSTDHDYDFDRAISPTKFLVESREEILKLLKMN